MSEDGAVAGGQKGTLAGQARRKVPLAQFVVQRLQQPVGILEADGNGSVPGPRLPFLPQSRGQRLERDRLAVCNAMFVAVTNQAGSRPRNRPGVGSSAWLWYEQPHPEVVRPAQRERTAHRAINDQPERAGKTATERLSSSASDSPWATSDWSAVRVVTT